MKNIAFIPLRGGSKSIPLKNIKLLGGKPLAYYVIDAADQCSEIDTIVVSTDCDIIKNLIIQHPSSKIKVISRSADVSEDNASTESVMLEFAQQYSCETIILIQATSPLLRAEHLTQGIQKYHQGFDSILSVVRQHRFLWNENGTPINYDYTKRPRRQDWDGVLVENGAFYITSYKHLLDSKCRLSGHIGSVEMPANTYWELDTPEDWTMVENLLKQNKVLDLSKIKMFLCDCDGTLTDSGMYYSQNGEELKKFNTRDGHAFQMLNEHGIITGIITGENTPIVAARGKKINAKEIALGIKDKLSFVTELAKKYGWTLDQIAFVGDDLNDVELLKAVGFAAVPNNAVSEAKSCAHYIASANGGDGVVREAVEYFFQQIDSK